MRTTTNPIVWITMGVLLALPALAAPVDGAREDLPVTDPVLLERLRFEPDAGNVYATPRALEELRMDPAERAALEETWLAERLAPSSSAGGPYGTNISGYSPFTAYTILPFSSQTSHGINSFHERVCVDGPPLFYANLEALPHGARLAWVDIWYYDNSPEQTLFTSLWRVCQPDFAAGSPQATLLGSYATIGAEDASRYRFIGPLDETIDLQSCAYLVRVTFHDPENPAICTALTDLRIQKLRVEWRRKVSPPPATATFDDVPTGHPFFQHVEALVASGITSGCGGDNFCPGAPLSRGQMAAFLAKALGLHWGDF